MNGRRRLVGSWAHGSMANAMAHAIGVQAAQPGRQVISMSGNGGFAMLMGDLITLTQMNLPVKVVIFNNGVLGFVALEMKVSGFVETGTDLQNPDFAAMARAMGIHAVRVEDPGDLPNAVRDVLAHDGPAVLDVVKLTGQDDDLFARTVSLPSIYGLRRSAPFKSSGRSRNGLHRRDLLRHVSEVEHEAIGRSRSGAT